MAASKTLKDAFAEASALPGPLRDRLKAYQESHRELRPDTARAYEALVERLARVSETEASPGIGDVMPEFVLPDEGGHLVSRADILRDGAAIISFNRGHWCPFCRMELMAMAAIFPAVDARGGNIVSIVPERQQYAQQLKATCELPFSVLQDIDNSLGLELGLVISVGDEMREIYQSGGIDLAEYQGFDSWFLPIPASYVVDQAGTIRAKFADPDFRKRAEPDDLLAAFHAVSAS
ncbi:MAG: peroxiredoxin-like family protein [Boseongicola sp.]